MAYVIDTPSRRLESYIILTPANVGQCLDSFLFDTSADGWPVWWSVVHEMYHLAVCDMMDGPASFLLSILDQWKAVWYAGFQQYIKHIFNLSISVKAAPSMISGALNGPSGCLQYDEGTTKCLVEYLTSMESCDMQDSNSTSYICVTSVCQSKQPLWWSSVRWMVHLAVCNMMRGPPSFLVSISHQWKAVMCRTLTVHHILYMCNLSMSVKAAPLMISSALNEPSGCLWSAGF